MNNPNQQEVTRTLSRFQAQRAVLLHPSVKKAFRIYPDAEFYISFRSVTLTCACTVEAQDGRPIPYEDIRDLPGVEAGTYGYYYSQTLHAQDLNLRKHGTGRLTVLLRAEQSYTQEEVDLLRACGKLQKIHQDPYETLVCGR